MSLTITLRVEDVTIGWVEAHGLVVGDAPPALATEVAAAVARWAKAHEDPATLARRAAVRDMLRHGRYRPTGRGKPSAEYLRQAAAEGRFPTINALVDVVNLVSLDSMLPISVVDLDCAGSDTFVVRRGREGEAYVFNPSGQVLDLKDLLLLARMPGDRPCATPVKDSQETKTNLATRSILAVVYGPEALSLEVRAATGRLAGLIDVFCGGSGTSGALP